MSSIKYKEIKIKISEKVFKDVWSALITKTMTGNFSGIADEVLMKIIKAIKKEKEQEKISYKKERKLN